MKRNILMALLVVLGLSACDEGDIDDMVTLVSDTTAPVFDSNATASVLENQLSAITLHATGDKQLLIP